MRIGNYLVPTCRFRPLCPRHAVKASRTWWGGRGKMMTEGVRDAIMSRRIMLPSLFPVLFFLPLYPLWHFLSLSVSLQHPPPSHFKSLSICLVILLHSLHIHCLFSLSLSLVLFFILSLSVCHLYSGGTWHPRAPVKYNCRHACVCMLMHTCLLACSCSGNMLSLNQICISNLSAGLLHWPGALLYLHIELWGSPESL